MQIHGPENSTGYLCMWLSASYEVSFLSGFEHTQARTKRTSAYHLKMESRRRGLPAKREPDSVVGSGSAEVAEVAWTAVLPSICPPWPAGPVHEAGGWRGKKSNAHGRMSRGRRLGDLSGARGSDVRKSISLQNHYAERIRGGKGPATLSHRL